MAEWVRRSERVEDTYFERLFDLDGGDGAGFMFDCDKDGNIETPEYPEARKNLAKCLTGVVDGRTVIDRGPVAYVRRYTLPGIIKCHCGLEVHLHNPLDNECDCGQCYNMSGQEVVPSWKCNEQGEPYSDYED